MYLAYYRPGQFPFPQGRSAGPYPRFLGAHSAGLARARRQHLGAHAAAYARLRRRLGDDTPILDTTGDYNYGDLTPPSPLPNTPIPIVSLPPVSTQPIDVGQGNLPLTSPSTTTAGTNITNYSPAMQASNPLSYVNAAAAIAAGLNPTKVNAAFAAQPSALSSSTWLLGGFVGIVGLMAFAGRKGGR